jgi:hypothetical protein
MHRVAQSVFENENHAYRIERGKCTALGRVRAQTSLTILTKECAETLTTGAAVGEEQAQQVIGKRAKGNTHRRQPQRWWFGFSVQSTVCTGVRKCASCAISTTRYGRMCYTWISTIVSLVIAALRSKPTLSAAGWSYYIDSVVKETKRLI